jgi:EmrB/QacA subfamily drug resistance transporter
MLDQTDKGFSGKWGVMLVVGIGTFMSTFVSSSINVSLPPISDFFGVSFSTVAWVSLAYLLITTSLLLLFGRAADMVGRKSVYILGFFIFIAGSAFCAVSSSILQLILSRSFQGVGAAMLMSCSPALVTDAFPRNQRGKALGILGTIVAAGLTMGPPLGGFLVENLGWRSIFYINIPIGLVGMACGWMILKQKSGQPLKQKFDYKGAIFLVIFLVLLLLVLDNFQRLGFKSVGMQWLLAGLLFFATLFLTHEAKVDHPLINLNLFRHRLFALANLSALLNFICLLSVTFLMPFYLERVLEAPTSRVGMILIAIPLCSSVIAPLSGSLSDKIGSRFLSSFGLFLVGVSLFSFVGLKADSSYADVVFRLIVLGVGTGMFASPNTSSIMGSVSGENLGVAAGVLATMRNLGMAIGVALTSSIFTSRNVYHMQKLSQETLGSLDLEKVSFVSSFHDVYWVIGFICVLGIFLSGMRGK